MDHSKLFTNITIHDVAVAGDDFQLDSAGKLNRFDLRTLFRSQVRKYDYAPQFHYFVRFDDASETKLRGKMMVYQDGRTVGSRSRRIPAKVNLRKGLQEDHSPFDSSRFGNDLLFISISAPRDTRYASLAFSLNAFVNSNPGASTSLYPTIFSIDVVIALDFSILDKRV